MVTPSVQGASMRTPPSLSSLYLDRRAQGSHISRNLIRDAENFKALSAAQI
jgi:hypothetical protein